MNSTCNSATDLEVNDRKIVPGGEHVGTSLMKSSLAAFFHMHCWLPCRFGFTDEVHFSVLL
jgi:hypothetical protein